MRYKSIREHLRPYVIKARRQTTINHAFAAAVAPNDEYDEDRVRAAIIALGQDPENDLRCVYCPKPAETWDHVYSTVLQRKFSGHGHRLGNLVPCCKACNSSKGNKKWDRYLTEKSLFDTGNRERENLITSFLAEFQVIDEVPNSSSPKYAELEKIRDQIIELCDTADRIAADIRAERRATKASTAD